MYQNIELFKDIDIVDISSMLHCIRGYEKQYKKNEFIILAGQKVEYIGIVLEGSIEIVKENVLGDRRIMTEAGKDSVFAESIVSAGVQESPVSVIAKEDSKILFVSLSKMLTMCSSACEFHNKLIFNLASILAKKNLLLSQKIDYLSAKTIRERLAKYFMDGVKRENSTTFLVPYSRNGLAEYLGVDRSVLSRELSKLKKEGVIDFNKNTFNILDPIKLGKFYAL